MSVLASCRHPEHHPVTSTEFYVLGTMHRHHLTARFRYSLTDLEAEVRGLAPDLICGEIVPQALGTRLEGVFPPEAAFLAVLAPELNAVFAASDWRADLDADHFKSTTTESSAPEGVESLRKPLLDQLDHFKGVTLFDLVHGVEFENLTRQIHESWIEAAGEAADGFSVTQNKRIVEKCLEAARTHHSRRVLFAFGQDHQYAIKDALRTRGLVGKSPPRMFKPSSVPVAQKEVMIRWMKNRAALEQLSKAPSTPADVQKMISGLKRIKELTLFIDSQGQAN